MQLVAKKLKQWLQPRRPPDYVIGGQDDPYLLRWWLIPRNKFFNVYYHVIVRDEDDRALHDHPWMNMSVVLSGAYREVCLSPEWLVNWRHARADLGITEEVPSYSVGCLMLPTIGPVRYQGAVVFRRADFPHRLEVAGSEPVHTLFVTGPNLRRWGFHCPKGWVFWKDFVDENDSGLLGPGCGE